MATELNIEIRSKRTQWGGITGEGDIVWLREDISAGTFKLEVRADPGDSGAALLTLNNASAGSEGVNASYDAGYLHPETSELVGATTVRLQINEATMEALAVAASTNEPVGAHYDIHLTISGVKRLWLFGKFTYHPGVTL